jgi:hypothetical protein
MNPILTADPPHVRPFSVTSTGCGQYLGWPEMRDLSLHVFQAITRVLRLQSQPLPIPNVLKERKTFA